MAGTRTVISAVSASSLWRPRRGAHASSRTTRSSIRSKPAAATYADVHRERRPGNNVALGYPVPIPVDSLTPVDGFRTYDSLFARHQSLLMDHDEVHGEIVGRTAADREIWAYRLGDLDTTTAEGFAEGAVLVNGGIHAREWQTPEAVTGLMEAIVEGKADGGFGQYLIENLTTVLLPVHNVDGFLQTQRFADRTTADRAQPRDGRMRRKNMRNPRTQGGIDEDLATVGDNFWGIDLNRNSVDGFGQAGGSSCERDQSHLSRRLARHRAGDRGVADRGDARAGGATAFLQRHAFLRPGLSRADHRQHPP